MALVTLAYPYDGHAPDETIEVDPATARRLVYEGQAREPDLDALPVQTLREIAVDRNVDLGGARSKDAIVAALEANPTPTPDTPPAGENQ